MPIKKKRNRSVRKGKNFEREIYQYLRKYAEDNFNTPPSFISENVGGVTSSFKFRALLLDAFAWAKKNEEASEAFDTNDLAIDRMKNATFLRDFPLQVEIKFRHDVSIKDAFEQAVESLIRTKYLKRILLIHKETLNQRWPNATGKVMCTMLFEDFLDLLIKNELYTKERRKWVKRKKPVKADEKSSKKPA